MHAREWYSPLLKYVGIGNKTHVRAGHAALVLIDKDSGVLEYHDFGRYITSEPHGRVRDKSTDPELDFPLKAKIDKDTISNLDEVLKFLGTNAKLTHGEGKLIASVCSAINYDVARATIDDFKAKGFMRYGAFIKGASNCARFVTSVLIDAVTDKNMKKRLVKSTRFTPSTIGNVILSDTEDFIYEVSEDGKISRFDSSVRKTNIKCFLDRLKDHEANFEGALEPKHNSIKAHHAQWLPGVGVGAWFELHDLGTNDRYRFRRISPYGDIDIDAEYTIDDLSFDINGSYTFMHNSNCEFFHVEQNGSEYKFEFDRLTINSVQKERSA